MKEQEIYDEIVAFFESEEASREAFGAGEAARWWARRRGMSQEDFNYFMAGLAFYWERYDSDEWQNWTPKRDTDLIVMLYLRAWKDRYGDAPSWQSSAS